MSNLVNTRITGTETHVSELTINIELVVLTISQSEDLFRPISKSASNSIGRWDTYPKLV
jgi:hypothetical protein